MRIRRGPATVTGEQTPQWSRPSQGGKTGASVNPGSQETPAVVTDDPGRGPRGGSQWPETVLTLSA